jgi:hypothetical protein
VILWLIIALLGIMGGFILLYYLLDLKVKHDPYYLFAGPHDWEEEEKRRLL